MRERQLVTLTLTEGTAAPDVVRAADDAFSVSCGSHAQVSHYPEPAVMTALYAAEGRPGAPYTRVRVTIGYLIEGSESAGAAARKDVEETILLRGD
jgi:hypothetical protein